MSENFTEAWADAPLGDLFTILDSQRVPVNSKERAKRAGGIPYYGATGQVGWIDDHLFDEELVLVGEDGAPFLQGDKPTAYVIRGKTWVNNHAHVLRALGGTPSLFWKYQLDQVNYRPFVSGTTRLKLSQAPMRRIPLVVPPVHEQHRIVEAIESYFTRLDDAVANLERVQRNLKRYRASVLKAAVEGRLVPSEAELARTEDRDFEPASVLLDRILAERRRRWEEAELAKMKAKGKTPKNDKWKAKYKEPAAPDTTDLPELPEGWCWASISQAFPTVYRYPTFYGMERYEEGVPVIRGEHLGSDGSISQDWTNYWFVSEQCSSEYPRTITKTGDLVMSVRGTIGKVGLVANALAGGQVSPNCIRLEPGTGLNAKFMLRWFHAPSTQERVAGKTAATTIKTIKASRLITTPIALPPVSEQQRIADEVDDLFSVAEKAAEIARSNARRANRLRQAILKWAFEGKLADQDPNDEPAVALLERIQAERAKTTTKKTDGRGRKKRGKA